MENNILNFLGIMLRSGNVSLGDSLIDDIRKNKVELVIVATNMGETSKKKVVDKSNYYKVKCVEVFTKEELSSSLGKNNISSLGIKSKGGAKKILDLLNS